MAKGKPVLVASNKAIDKSLDALFASSSGPVKAPEKSRYSELLPLKDHKPIQRASVESGTDEDGDEEEDDEVLSEIEDEDEEMSDVQSEEPNDAEDGHQAASSSEEEQAEETLESKKKDRKRKRKDEFDDLESKYLRKLADDDAEDVPSEKRRKGDAGQAIDGDAAEGSQKGEDEDDSDETPIIHESLQKAAEDHPDVEVDKANRTLFLGNVSIEAISSSKAKKELMAHLASPLADLDTSSGPHKVESLRFRSTPFSGGSMPKRAAYITKSLMPTTTHSTNAYVVYSTPLAARTALKALNGTSILDRHMRVDSVAHPTPVDHRRCVFVGNLGFVDDETMLHTNAEGETTSKKRNKTPADVEEGLWRTFNKKAGKVESVRVPRDAKTRVGKGFAYVQFYDGNDIEAALLLDGKKFPPMLPRALRVSRAKDPRKTANAMERSLKAKLAGGDDKGDKPKSTKYKHKATPEQQSLAGRAGHLLGRAGAARQKHGLKGDGKKRLRHRDGEKPDAANGLDLGALKTPEQIVFEGRRASAKDGTPKDLKFGKVRGKKGAVVKIKKRGARRAAEWRKKGGK